LLLTRVIISGGGTGGHIFPAIAIANEIKARNPEAEILFVGANGRMEMKKVPEAGFAIEGLDIAGLQRKLDLKNLLLPFKIWRSLNQSKRILKKFKPQLAVGVGGYASAPLLYMAQRMNIPTLIQEQNSYAGLSNRLLARRAKRICVAYPGLEKQFPADRVRLTGNPVRKDILDLDNKREEAIEHFGLREDQPIILAIGGSLGARSINEALHNNLKVILKANCQLLWQCGKGYYAKVGDLDEHGIKVFEFIREMDLAYAAADVVISRAGALSVSELCLVQKSAVLVPSPYVAEDHQTKNAKVLVDSNAALMVKETDTAEELVSITLNLVHDESKRASLQHEISHHAKPNAVQDIVNELEGLV